MMYAFLLIVSILAALAAVIFFEPVRISFLLDTDEADLRARARWMPVAALDARLVDARPFVTLRFFGKRVYEGFFRRSGGKKRRGALVKAAALSDTRVSIACGFHEPHLTGIFYAAANAAAAFVNASALELEPNFLPEKEFVKIRAKTALNIGRTLANMAREKLKTNRKEKRIWNSSV